MRFWFIIYVLYDVICQTAMTFDKLFYKLCMSDSRLVTLVRVILKGKRAHITHTKVGMFLFTKPLTHVSICKIVVILQV